MSFRNELLPHYEAHCSTSVAGGWLAVAGGGRRRCVLAAAVLESGVTEERVDFVYTFDNIS